MATKEAEPKSLTKIVVPVPAPVAVKPKTVVVASPVAVKAVTTATNVLTTIQTALPAKVRTASPVVGKANY